MTQDTTTTSGAADLIAAAQAVVDRWDTPLWKDVPATAEYIGRLRAALAAGQATAQAAPENIRGILARCRDFIDTTKAPAYPAGADLADEIDVLLAAQPAPQPSHVAQAVVQDDLITLRKPTTSAELLWLLKLAHLVISDMDKTMEETFSPAQPAAQQAKSAAYAALPEYGINTASHAHFRVLGFTADQMRAFADATCALRPSRGQAPAGANENAKLVTLIAECRDAFPIPAHGDPIENYWSAAIEDPSNVPAYLQEIAKRKQADSVQEDAALQLIADLVRHIDRETCTHEETHRGGAIWEICNSCGSMWADDKGGKPEFKWSDCVEKARAFLDAARKQGASNDR